MDENTLVMAEALARSEVEEGVRRVVGRLPVQPPDFDGRCVECDDQMPDGRIKFGAIRCLPCQEFFETTLRTTSPATRK
jgi:hypothetical protein